MQTDHAAQRGRDAFGTATRISASLLRRLSAFFRSVSDQAPKAAKLAVLIPGPGMLVNVRNAPRVVIAPCHLARSESTAHRAKKQQHHQIANRVAQPSGAATPRNSDAHKRIAAPKALCVLQERLRPSPKSGKVCCSTPWPRRVSEPCETLRG